MQLITRTLNLDLNNPSVRILSDLMEEFRRGINRFISYTELSEEEFYLAMNYIFISRIDEVVAESTHHRADCINLNSLEASNLEKGMNILKNSAIPFYVDQAKDLAVAVVGIEYIMGQIENMDLSEPYSEQFSLNLNTISHANWLASGAINDLKARFCISYEKTVDIHLQGAEARSKKYIDKKVEAFKIFKAGSFYSYAECARAIHEQLGIKDPNTIARWLSEMSKKS